MVPVLKKHHQRRHPREGRKNEQIGGRVEKSAKFCGPVRGRVVGEKTKEKKQKVEGMNRAQRCDGQKISCLWGCNHPPRC